MHISNVVKISVLSMVLAYSLPSLAASVSFDLKGTFSDNSPPCEIKNNLTEAKLNATAIRSVGAETPAVNSGNFTIDCDFDSRVNVLFVSAPINADSTAFATSSKSVGVKVKVKDTTIKPMQRVPFEFKKGVNTLPFDVSLVRANNLPDTQLTHDYELRGFIDIEYQ